VKLDRKISINLGNLLLSLSEVTDLANPFIAQHQMRTAFIASQLAKAADVGREAAEDIFAAALLHDIGAISVEEKIKLHNFEEGNLGAHCAKGELLFKRFPLFAGISQIVKHHHTPWRVMEESGLSFESPLALASQIVLFADYLERLISRNKYVLHQTDDITERLASLVKATVHPRIHEYFLSISATEEFWLDIVSPRLYSILLSSSPYANRSIELDEMVSVSELFRDIIDFKSRFTSTHSIGVSSCAEILSRLFGLTDFEIRLMQVAGNLHDIGKMIVPNSILDKPDKLTKEEFGIMRCHTYYTYYVIKTIGGLQQIAEWAGYHHEKLDGTGYPFHCGAVDLTIGSRIMTVADIFTAIAEDRPYRKGMNRDEIIKVLADSVAKSHLDSRVVDLVVDNYEQVRSHVMEKQQKGREFYDNFMTNKKAETGGH
jgi:HD-GYP domain-containing protein (c-di-GMP phosphodiesterase class II)